MALDFDPTTARLPAEPTDAFDPSTAQPIRKRNLAAVANDTVIEVANAAAGGVSAAANFIKPGNALSSAIDKNIIQAGEASQSDAVKAAKQTFRQDVAQAEGPMDELGAVCRYVVDNPVLLAAGSFAGPGLAAKGGNAFARLTGAGAQGVARGGMAGGAAAAEMRENADGLAQRLAALHKEFSGAGENFRQQGVPQLTRDAQPIPLCGTRAERNGECIPKTIAKKLWCPGPESNRHALRRGILSPLRLPISPPGQGIREDSNYGTVGRMKYPTIEDAIGKTPLVALQRIGAADSTARGNVILGKLEGNNPAGSVKDRPALSMIRRAEERGDIRPGDTLIEATSGNTGIALAMAAAIKGYRMVLVMPEDLSVERAQTMKAFGADLVLTPKSGGMEHARDLAEAMQKRGEGKVLDQFANADNPRIHYETTGPELWEQTDGRITHFVSAMGTTGTITGVSRFLKEKNAGIQIIGAQPQEGSRIPGIRKWPQEYLPKIFDPSAVDETVNVSQDDAEDMARRLAREEGIFGGISAAGACWAALQLSQRVSNATIVFVVCDRGDRYLSTGVFPA